MRVKLKTVQGKPEGKEITVPGDRFVIGRGEDCQLRPNSELVSRTHCAIYVQPDRAWIRDLGSRNGTQVNGESIKGDLTLKTGDVVQVGPLVFSVTLVDAPEPAAQNPAVASTPPALAAGETIAESSASALARGAAKSVSAKAAAAMPRVVKGGSAEQDAAADSPSAAEISAWLVSDATHSPPASPADVYTGDTQTFNALDDTTPDGPKPTGVQPEPQSKPAVEKKSSSGKRAAPSPEATSRAAADILRQFLTRRPEQ